MKSTGTTGTNAVDWEARVDFDRLRGERLAELEGRAGALRLGALLAFDFSNIRYMTATHIGTWAMDKLIRFSLLTRNSDPISWDFGSAAKHHQLYNPWLDVTTAEMDADPNAPHEGAVRPRLESRRARRHLDAARRVHARRRHRRGGRRARSSASSRSSGSPDQPLGVDVIELPILFALQQRGHRRRRRPAGVHGGPPHQDRRRDPPAHAGGVDGGCRLRGAVPVPPSRRARERGGRAGRQDALRPRLGVRRGRQRDLGRALLAAPARVLRPAHPARRPGVLRHPAQLQRLPHLLLPHLRGRARRAPRSATRTPAPASTWTARSRW